MNREFRQQLAHDTLAALKNGFYQTPAGRVDFAEAQHAAQAGSRLYTPADVASLLREFDQPAGPAAEVRVYGATTLAAAAQLNSEFSWVGVLNFASARHPGGGFLGGSQAQEESLARSSGLYPCLTQFAAMYAYNSRPASTALYSDYLVYSPGVPVLRHDDGQWLAQPQLLDIITAPAVNAGALARNSPALLPQLALTMRQRLRLVLAVAARQGIEALVLGAWGCGVLPTTRPTSLACLPKRWPTPPSGGVFAASISPFLTPNHLMRCCGSLKKRWLTRNWPNNCVTLFTNLL